MKRLKIFMLVVFLISLTSCKGIIEHIKEAQRQSTEEKQKKFKLEFPDDQQARRPRTEREKKPKTEGTHNFYSEKWKIALSGKEDLNLLKEIDEWLGVPYRNGGTTKAGVDCSGFVLEVYKKVYNLDLHRRSVDIWQNSSPVKREDLRSGDLVFFKINFRQISHVGIYINESYFAHASSSRGVIIESLNVKYWNDRFDRGGRINK